MKNQVWRKMEEQQLSSGSCSCPPFGLKTWYFVHDDYQIVIMLNIRFEERWMNNSLVVATIGKTVTLPCRVLMQEVLSSFIPNQLSPPFFAFFLSPSFLFLFLESSYLLCPASFYSIWQLSQSATVSWSVQRKSTMDLLTVRIEFEIMQKFKILKQIFWL